MAEKGLWDRVRERAHVVFPAVAAVEGAVVLASPFFPDALAFLYDTALMRFGVFWVMALCVVLAFSNRILRPSLVAFFAAGVGFVFGCVFVGVFAAVAGAPANLSNFTFPCMAGAIIGALAGTWLEYFFDTLTRPR